MSISLTAPVELDPLRALVLKLQSVEDSERRTGILDEEPSVVQFLTQHREIRTQLETLGVEGKMVFRALIAVGQGELLLAQADDDRWSRLTERLWHVETFYHHLGGLVGYHLKVLELLRGEVPSERETPVIYRRPLGIDLSMDTLETRRATIWGIEALSDFGEIYPIGGAGDRLGLISDVDGEPLPAARLLFGGRTLLAGMVEDLQAREYLYYKLHGEQVCAPLALMTSDEKDNHRHILEIFEENHWFHRPRDRFFFFTQPLVPVISETGRWLAKGPLDLVMKPGGHGVLWKLAQESGALHWLSAQGCHRVVIRQINNPMASTDYGLLAFLGIGWHKDKAFGFASCPRRVHSAEGMNVLEERQPDDSHQTYGITNVEYTDFVKKGIADLPAEPESPFSAFPANTNILFADLRAIEEALNHNPIPGLLVNTKTRVQVSDEEGHSQHLVAVRLESTMQNIADTLADIFDRPLKPGSEAQLRTYLTFNDRQKTISVTKRSYIPGGSPDETPVSCFYDLMSNHDALLRTHCAIQLPALQTIDAFLREGPRILFLFHPALGPLYSIIGQKIRGGTWSAGSELQLRLTNVALFDLHLQGSLLIEAEDLLGHSRADGSLAYSEKCGRCFLRNCAVQNEGIDRSANNVYWQNRITRRESLHIKLRGNAEFFADGVTFAGDQTIEVPAGHRMVAEPSSGGITYKLYPIEGPSWHWSYRVDNDSHIILERL